MSSIDAVPGSVASQVAAEVAVRVMQMANDQQQTVATLLSDAVATAEQVQQAGKGEHVDVTA